MKTLDYLSKIIYFKCFISLTLFIFIISPIIAQKKQKADQMPYLISSGCSNKSSNEMKACSDKALLDFIYNHIKYPEVAKKKKVEGTAIISFTINKKGNIDETKIIKDIGYGCGEEAVRVIKLMNEKNMKWVPAKKGKKTIATKYNLPIRFSLKEDSAIKSTKKKIHTMVDEMPYMVSVDCGQGVPSLERLCGNKALRDFIKDNMQYPEEAKKNKTEGMSIISFIINEDGAINDITILRNLPDGCGEEAARVIHLMSQQHAWVPGLQEGVPVSVKLNLPVQFKLNQ